MKYSKQNLELDLSFSIELYDSYNIIIAIQ